MGACMAGPGRTSSRRIGRPRCASTSPPASSADTVGASAPPATLRKLVGDLDPLSRGFPKVCPFGAGTTGGGRGGIQLTRSLRGDQEAKVISFLVYLSPTHAEGT